MRRTLGRGLAGVCAGDELVVWELSRAGGSLAGLLDVIARLHAQGCGFRSLSEGIEARAPEGVATDLFAVLARFGRERAGDLPATRPRGRAGGRKPLAPAKVMAMQALWAEGTMTAGEIAARLEVGRRTVFKYVRHSAGGPR